MDPNIWHQVVNIDLSYQQSKYANTAILQKNNTFKMNYFVYGSEDLLKQDITKLTTCEDMLSCMWQPTSQALMSLC